MQYFTLKIGNVPNFLSCQSFHICIFHKSFWIFHWSTFISLQLTIYRSAQNTCTLPENTPPLLTKAEAKSPAPPLPIKLNISTPTPKFRLRQRATGKNSCIIFCAVKAGSFSKELTQRYIRKGNKASPGCPLYRTLDDARFAKPGREKSSGKERRESRQKARAGQRGMKQ